ncbi:MAG: hypothetical protein J3R72DRAFT_494988 [Linnemannia gamsii]|nr:MAG: hypothetical protein J3R72DRAFT_494988 [Linnemannia gamsii]
MPCNTRSQDKKRQQGHLRHQEKETIGNKNNRNKTSQPDEFQAMMSGLEKHQCNMSAEHKIVKQERDSLGVELVLKEVLCAHPMMRQVQGQDQGGGGGVGRSRLLSLDEMATSWLETFAKYSRKDESSTLIHILRRLEDDKKQQAKNSTTRGREGSSATNDRPAVDRECRLQRELGETKRELDEVKHAKAEHAKRAGECARDYETKIQGAPATCGKMDECRDQAVSRGDGQVDFGVQDPSTTSDLLTAKQDLLAI